MNRGGFFARLAQAAAVPVAVALGRSMPSAPMVTGYGVGAVTLSSTDEMFGELATEPEVAEIGYQFNTFQGYGVIRSGPVTESVLREAGRTPGVTFVAEFVHAVNSWIPKESHWPIVAP